MNAFSRSGERGSRNPFKSAPIKQIGAVQSKRRACRKDFRGAPEGADIVFSVLPEQAEQRLRPLVGDAQGLHGQLLLLHLQGRQPCGFPSQIGIDDVAETGFGRVTDLREELGLEIQGPNFRTERTER